MSCHCAEINFVTFKTRQEVDSIVHRCNEKVNNGEWKYLQTKKSGGFTENTYLCNTCNKTIQLNYVTKTYRGHFNIKLEETKIHTKELEIKSEPIKRLLDFLLEKKVKINYKGKNYYDEAKPGVWIGFDCYYDEKNIRKQFNFGDNIKYWEYNGMAAGHESGFMDQQTGDAILGWHPSYAQAASGINRY